MNSNSGSAPLGDAPTVLAMPDRDLLDDTVYAWHRGWNYVRLDPGVRQGHILKVERP